MKPIVKSVKVSKKSGATLAMRARNWGVAQQIDAMAVDQVIRWKQAEVPARKWIYGRALLNGYWLAIHLVGPDMILLRLK